MDRFPFNTQVMNSGPSAGVSPERSFRLLIATGGQVATTAAVSLSILGSTVGTSAIALDTVRPWFSQNIPELIPEHYRDNEDLLATLQVFAQVFDRLKGEMDSIPARHGLGCAPQDDLSKLLELVGGTHGPVRRRNWRQLDMREWHRGRGTQAGLDRLSSLSGVPISVDASEPQCLRLNTSGRLLNQHRLSGKKYNIGVLVLTGGEGIDVWPYVPAGIRIIPAEEFDA